MVFPFEVSIISFNVQRSVVPRTDVEATEDKFKFVIDRLAAGVDFVCLQEVGVTDDADIAVLSARLEKVGAVIRSAGVEDGSDRGNTGVAVVVANGWDVLSVDRHDSGRAIALVVGRGACRVTVISTYMPPGLDNLGREHSSSRLAEDVYYFLQQHVVASEGRFLIGGDLNETRAALDRAVVDGAGVSRVEDKGKRVYRARLINEFLGKEDVVVDIVRRCNPDRRVVTRIGSLVDGTSYSRLDYILVPAGMCVDGVGEWRTEVRSHGVQSDHLPVWASFRPCGGSSSDRMDDPRPWRPDVLSVTRTPRSMQNAIVRECEDRARKMIAAWPKPTGERGRRVRVLNAQVSRCLAIFGRVLERRTRKLRLRRDKTGMDAFRDMSEDQLRGFLSSRFVALPEQSGRDALLHTIRVNGLHWEQPRDPSHPLSALERDRALLSVARELRHSLALIAVPDGGYAVDSKAHRRVVGRLQSVTGKYHGVRHDDVQGLRVLVDEILGDKEVRRRMLMEWQARPSADRQHSRLLRALHVDPRRLGEFIKRFLRGISGARCSLDRATDGDGVTVYDPEVYKPIIRAEVAAPLSTKVDLPPPFVGEKVIPEIHEVDGRFRSTDVRVRGCRPFWFDEMYAGRGVHFDDVMRAPTAAEVFRIIQRAGSGKSPGHDLLDIDFWKLVTAAGPGESLCLEVMVLIMAECLELGVVPDVLKVGWITMVPKVKPDGSFQCKASEMRPITVLPELGKITSRLLAARINSVLVRRPELLAEAQRGFINDGSVDQCCDVLLDVIEDWRQRTERRGKARGKREHLYVASYDQAKAYDSVQGYTIEASLRRVGMPARLVEYVMSSLSGATSRVRTAGGLTDPFPLMSGVRQGDPLSPLIYIFVMDAFHAGLVENPLFPEECKSWGYQFSHGPRVLSCGYCDDTVIVASSAKALMQMHAWVREFFGAHCLTLNCDKTVLVCSDGSEPVTIPSVDGTGRVASSGEERVFRYLGIWVSLRLDWTVQIGRMDRLVRSVCSSIRRNKLDLTMSITAARQYLLPCIRAGLRVADISRTQVREWDGWLRRAVVDGADMSMGRSLNVEALYALVRLPRLEHEQWALRGEEDLVVRNCEYPSSRTARARDAAFGSGVSRLRRAVSSPVRPPGSSPPPPPFASSACPASPPSAPSSSSSPSSCSPSSPSSSVPTPPSLPHSAPLAPLLLPLALARRGGPA